MHKAVKAKRCPICGKPETVENSPFCSPRCKDRDLLKWLGDGYRIPGPPADEHDPLGRVDSEEGEG
ncbi:MAG: DNA gyrase inhibitor YacG [Sphingomicrobium sp.]